MLTLKRGIENKYPVSSLQVAFRNISLLKKDEEPDMASQKEMNKEAKDTTPAKQTMPLFYEYKIKPPQYEFY